MFEVLTAHGVDALRWHSVWSRLPADLRDVHYSPAYGRVQEVLGGQARCMVYEWDDWIVMQPFMLRGTVDPRYRDMTSMYGHGGPLCTMRSISAGALMEYAEIEFAKWRAEHRVVSEFCQLHPMLEKDQDRLIAKDAQIKVVRETVAMRVDWADEYIIKGMRADRRQNLEKAAHIQITSALGSTKLSSLYTETMKRRGADKRWLFSFDYFDSYVHEVGADRMAFLFAYGTGHVISVASMILFGGAYAHYQFTGNEAPPTRGANDKLIMEAARLARRAGCSWLLLGGGTTSEPDDPLLQFKSGFSKHRFPARTYSRIFDADAYADLCRAAGRDPAAAAGFFPAYRAEAT